MKLYEAFILVFVASALSTQTTRKSKGWLSRNQDNVSMLSDMSTR